MRRQNYARHGVGDFRRETQRRFAIVLLVITCVFVFFVFSRSKNESELKNAEIILDICTEEEFNAGHRQGAKRVTMEQIENIEKLYPNKENKISIYARSENDAEKAYKILKEKGYKVNNLGVYKSK